MKEISLRVTIEEEYTPAPKWTRKANPDPFKKQQPLDLPGVLVSVKIEEEYTVLSSIENLNKMTPEEIAEALEEEAFQKSLREEMNLRRLRSRQCLVGHPLRISSKDSRERKVCKHCAISLDPKVGGDRWQVTESWPGSQKDWWRVCLPCSHELDRQASARDYKTWVKEQIRPSRKDVSPLRAGNRDKIPEFETWWKAYKKDGMRMDLRDEHSFLSRLASTLDAYRKQ